jgi:hypothetical protein
MEKLYLEINFKDNDWQDVMTMILPAISATIVHYYQCLRYSEQEDIQGWFEGIRAMIVAQRNLVSWYDEIRYNHADDAAQIDFALVSKEEIKTTGNYETVYVQLFSDNKQDVGSYFFV